MNQLLPFVMSPLLVAFLMFVILGLRFDQASFRTGANLPLACLCVAAAIFCIGLNMTHLLTPRIAGGFGLFAALLLAGAIAEVADWWRVS